jgi:hypothetical protein
MKKATLMFAVLGLLFGSVLAGCRAEIEPEDRSPMVLPR